MHSCKERNLQNQKLYKDMHISYTASAYEVHLLFQARTENRGHLQSLGLVVSIQISLVALSKMIQYFLYTKIKILFKVVP